MLLRKLNIINLLVILLCIMVSCKVDSKADSIIYLFPTKRKTISDTEVDSLCDKLFFLRQFTTNDLNFVSRNFDSITFKKNGEIFSSKLKIGKWDRDRKIYFSNVKTNFFISSLSSNGLRIQTRYKIPQDTLIKTATIHIQTKIKSIQDCNGLDF